jgi:hypothetical protein
MEPKEVEVRSAWKGRNWDWRRGWGRIRASFSSSIVRTQNRIGISVNEVTTANYSIRAACHSI